ncbi:peptide ABC transporter substrate-binding protein [Actinoplanes sp. NPDC026623]|uniref:peptide ABC transporter substrate-binding protein n=1 Tax=Actinoplanes sp. NPDC026623 TaxID=3155610 RepID=UPI0033F6B667
MSLYRDPRDKRVFVPKKGGGLVLNFGHPVAWWIVISTTIIPLIIVVGVTIAVMA